MTTRGPEEEEAFRSSSRDILKSAFKKLDLFARAMRAKESSDPRHSPISWKERIISFLSGNEGEEEESEPKKSCSNTPASPLEERISRGMTGEAAKPLSDHTITLHPASLFFREAFEPPFPASPPDQMMDIFRMKVISMIGKENLALASFPEALRLVREAPVEVHRDEKSPAVLSLQQTVVPFPGESIQCRGSFVQNQKERGLVPIPGSFHVQSKVAQTGFPHPSQTSWGLADALIPSDPLHPHKLPLLQALLRKKAVLAHALLPNGSYNGRAKKLLDWRREVYRKHKEHYVTRFQQMTDAVIGASGLALHGTEKQLLRDFFVLMQGHTNPFPILHRAQWVLRESFIQHPYQKLMQEWLAFRKNGLTSRDPSEKVAYASQVLFDECEYAKRMLLNALGSADTPEKKGVVYYVLLLGERLSGAVHAILLQQMSEKIGYAAVALNDFAKKILTASLEQVDNFFQEVKTRWERSTITYREMVDNQWEREYALYTTNSFYRVGDPLAIVTQEIERYFRQRYVQQGGDEESSESSGRLFREEETSTELTYELSVP